MPHRQELTSAYNQYQRVRTDAAYRAPDENYQMLLRPLFITSFVVLLDALETSTCFAPNNWLSSRKSASNFGASLVHDCFAGSAQSHDPIRKSEQDLPGQAEALLCA